MFPIVQYVNDDAFKANARNWPGFVQVKRNVPYRAAVVAQEAWESMHKMDPLKLFHRVFLRSDNDRREFEYMGHEIETQAALILYGARQVPYRTREAMSMRGGYDGIFNRISITDIEKEMRARSPKAKLWIYANIDHLRKHMETEQ